MICQLCRSRMEKSRVYHLGDQTTLMSWTPYYDEQGQYVSNDPNTRTSFYRCSNGHRWSTKERNGAVEAPVYLS